MRRSTNSEKIAAENKAFADIAIGNESNVAEGSLMPLPAITQEEVDLIMDEAFHPGDQ